MVGIQCSRFQNVVYTCNSTRTNQNQLGYVKAAPYQTLVITRPSPGRQLHRQESYYFFTVIYYSNSQTQKVSTVLFARRTRPVTTTDYCRHAGAQTHKGYVNLASSWQMNHRAAHVPAQEDRHVRKGQVGHAHCVYVQKGISSSLRRSPLVCIR